MKQKGEIIHKWRNKELYNYQMYNRQVELDTPLRIILGMGKFEKIFHIFFKICLVIEIFFGDNLNINIFYNLVLLIH